VSTLSLPWLVIESTLWYLASGLTAATSFLNVLIVSLTGQNINREIKLKYVLYASALTFWSVNVLIFSSIPNEQLSFFCSQLLHFGAIFIPVFLLDFVLSFFKIRTRINKIELWIVYVLSIGFAIADLFFPTYFMLDVVPKRNYPFFLRPGPLYSWWVALFAYIVFSAHFKLLLCYSKVKGENKKRLGLFVFPSLIAYGSCIAYFLPVYDIFVFPYPWGCFGSMVLSSALAYGILRHKLLGVDVFVRKTLVFTGLFGFVMAVVAGVTTVMRSYVGQFFPVNPNLSMAISVLIAILLYDPARASLVNITDKYLFQKKQDIKTILNRLSAQIITILDLEKVGKTILETLQNSLRLETGVILVKNEDGDAYPVLDSFGFQPEETAFPREGELIRYFLEQERPVNLENEEAKKDLPSSILMTLQKMGAHIVLPLFVHSDLIALLILGKKKSDEEYKQDEIDYFPTLAGQGAIALSNARLYDILKKSEVDFAQQAKMAAIGTLSAGIGHEVKNPLAAIKIGVEMIKFNKKLGVYKDLDKAQYEAVVDDVIERVLANVSRAAGVIDRLSSFARKPKEIKIEPVHLPECFHAALALLKQELEHYNIVVNQEFPPGFPPALADKFQMEEIFLNLLVNARHAIKENGQIKIKGSSRNGEIEVAVSDTGAGIPKENLDKIFDPFFTTKDVSRNPDESAIRGTGLGLFLVREFIKKFGGRISVESEVDKGTTFHIFLKQAL